MLLETTTAILVFVISGPRMADSHCHLRGYCLGQVFHHPCVEKLFRNKTGKPYPIPCRMTSYCVCVLITIPRGTGFISASMTKILLLIASINDVTHQLLGLWLRSSIKKGLVKIKYKRVFKYLK